MALEKRAPLLVENPKSILYVHGSKCSQVVQNAFKDLVSQSQRSKVKFNNPSECVDKATLGHLFKVSSIFFCTSSQTNDFPCRKHDYIPFEDFLPLVCQRVFQMINHAITGEHVCTARRIPVGIWVPQQEASSQHHFWYKSIPEHLVPIATLSLHTHIAHRTHTVQGRGKSRRSRCVEHAAHSLDSSTNI